MAVLIWLLLATPAFAARPGCPGGRFLVGGPPLLAQGDAGTDTIAVGDEAVAIASGCDAIPSRRTGNRVRAASRSCPGGRVRMTGRISDRCRMLRGTLHAHRRQRRFTAMRVPYDFVQPLDLDFRYEDRHVIAFFDGHPDYEAVEAF